MKKSKVPIITLLLALLVLTVYQMMRFESSIRAGRTTTLYIGEGSEPLPAMLSDADVRSAALNADYYFTAAGEYFKRMKPVRPAGDMRPRWEELFLKGVNLGVALPGKFPAEFPLSFDQYMEWLRSIGEMNANVVRVYTILPPVFYEALAYYNLHHGDKPVYLMQGVWFEAPDHTNYYNPGLIAEFQKEIADAIDVIHGSAALKQRAGKAWGTYSADVSKNTVGILLGREWEPGSVHNTIQSNAQRQYRGNFVCMNDGNPMEAWLGRMLDFTIVYETYKYHFQHPISFVNWLPLDPMHHNSEIIENAKVREFDNDLESVDFSRFNATPLFPPGIYAAYHAYPYYPDFIYLDKAYRNDTTGTTYSSYLKDLKAHTPGMPLVIAEYGIPSSRGNSHASPFGFHQGGHSEANQAALSLTLTRDIVTARCAGALYFEWIDEWFKHNWLVMDFEQPAEDRKIWHNMENPEQNFGICALESRTRAVDGSLADWGNCAFNAKRIDLKAHADASYFYLAATIPDFDFNRHRLFIAIDTYDKEKGDHRLPFSRRTFDNGFEFLLEFKSKTDAAILVDEPYSVFTDIDNDHIPVYASQKNANATFIRQRMLTNRNRESLFGVRTDSIVVDRSPLTHGKSSLPESSNADWCLNDTAGIFEIRLAWHLLNVCDPARRYVLDDRDGTDTIEYQATDAFKMFLFVTDTNGVLLRQYPDRAPYSYTWAEWNEPVYTTRLKPIYYTLRNEFKNLTPPPPDIPSVKEGDESFMIAEYFNDRPSAVSIAFDNAGFSQYQFGLPTLRKYGFSATFGLIPTLLDEVASLHELDDRAPLTRLSVGEARDIALDNEIAYQPREAKRLLRNDLLTLGKRVNAPVNCAYWTSPSPAVSAPGALFFIRAYGNDSLAHATFTGIDYALADFSLSPVRLDSIINRPNNPWTIVRYYHIYDSENQIPSQLSAERVGQLFIHRADFDKQIRLIRNSGCWVAPISQVYQYRQERKRSSLRVTRVNDSYFLQVVNRLDQTYFNIPVTIRFRTNAKIVTVKGSETDGTYSNKDGYIRFNVRPHTEVTVEVVL
jgi:hypothetical protein